jgi:4-hydroxybenzoate polyprenyltransferase
MTHWNGFVHDPETDVSDTRSPTGLTTWLRAIRAHQWVKNLLIFVPAILAAPVVPFTVWPQLGLGFSVLGCFASAAYLLNDLVDLKADRTHRSKRLRPLAAGLITPRSCVLIGLTLAGAGAGLLLLMPAAFAVVALLYLTTTVLYSLALKRVAILDALCLGFLFTVRIYSGTVLLGGPTPYWLFAFSMFFFVSLALVKRYTEIYVAVRTGRDRLSGRAYRAADLSLVQIAGIGSAISAVVVFLIYLGDQQFNRKIFGAPYWLTLTCTALAFWLLHMWVLAGRDEMHDDPILFALRDKTSLSVAVVVLISLALAW